MSKTWDEIWATMHARRIADQPLLKAMVETRDRYHGDVVIPILNVPDEPQFPQLAPQLIHDGIENTAMRAAMALPQAVFPALDPGKSRGKRSVEYAGIRRRAAYGAWDFSLMQLLLGRWFRHLAGYGTFSAVVVPDFKYGRARVEARDPLTAYPELRSAGDMRPPINVGFVFGRSDDYLRRNYGSLVQDTCGTHPDGNGIWDVTEWIDEDEIVIGVLGPRGVNGSGVAPASPSAGRGVELRRWPNRAGCVPAAVPRRITLDRIAGQMEAMTGAADWLDRLMALNVMAAEKNIFPDMYVLGAENNEEPRLVDGEWHDGRTGKVNLVSGARAIGQLVSTTGPMTQAVVAQLERAGRMSGGVIPQYGGEAPGSLRTGRAIDTLGSFSVDPRVKELQDIMAAALARSINPAILEIEKGYWPDKKFVVFSGWPGDTGTVEYTPGVHFETTENTVNYAFPGTDISQVSVATLQLVGGDLMSKKTARIKHPMIDDADAETEQILIERLDEGIFASVLQQTAAGQVPMIDAAQIRKNIALGMSLDEAILDADEKARARQAATAPPPGPDQAMAPEAAPGLSQPGMGAEMQPPIQPLPAGQQNLRDLLRAVRTK